MCLEKLLNEFENRSLDEIILSEEFQKYKDSLEHDWEPLASKDRITYQDIQDYLW